MSRRIDHQAYVNGPMWYDFGLSYASYLVLPRALMCGMPVEWQERMLALLNEARETYDTSKMEDDYVVQLRGEGGRFKQDPLADYRHVIKLPYREDA